MNEAFRTAHYLHKHGRKLGVVLVPDAPIEMIYPYISHLDKITVMMVDPGFSGGIFVPEALDTVRKLKELRKEKGYHYIDMLPSYRTMKYKSSIWGYFHVQKKQN